MMIILSIVWQVCFGYKGSVFREISFEIQFTDKAFATLTAIRRYSFERSRNLKKWNFVCMDIYNLVIRDSWVRTRMSPSPNIKLSHIIVSRDGSGSEDALIDNVWIGSQDLTGSHEMISHHHPARINNVQIFFL